MTPTIESHRLHDRYGPWAVVAGASDGIGRAFAEELARSGLNVLLAARRLDRLQELAERLATDTGVEARAVGVDLRRQEGVERLLQASRDLDVGLLVESAGFGTSGPFVRSDLREELDMIDVNCRALAALSHAFGGRFAAQGRGGLVLLSSLMAFQGVPRAATYAATKAFVQTFAEGLQVELAPHGVDVLAVAPGPVETGFAARANLVMSMAERPEKIARGSLAALGRRPIVRPGRIAKLLELALSPLPRRARVGVMGKVVNDMTKHQRVTAARLAEGSAR
jgi:uncharacterized protein